MKQLYGCENKFATISEMFGNPLQTSQHPHCTSIYWHIKFMQNVYLNLKSNSRLNNNIIAIYYYITEFPNKDSKRFIFMKKNQISFYSILTLSKTW